MKVAVLTIDSFSSSDVVKKVIARHSGDIGLVVSSTAIAEKGLARHIHDNWKRSGFNFLVYLGLNFTFFSAVNAVLDFFSLGDPDGNTLKKFCRKRSVTYADVGNVNSEAFFEILKKSECDTILVIYFDQILREQLIARFSGRIFNMHGALLPKYRGLFPVEWVAFNGETSSGCTLHEICDLGIDSGPIISSVAQDFPAEMDVLNCARFVNLKGYELIADLFLSGDHGTRDCQIESESTYYSFPTRQNILYFYRFRRKLFNLSEYLLYFFRGRYLKR